MRSAASAAPRRAGGAAERGGFQFFATGARRNAANLMKKGAARRAGIPFLKNETRRGAADLDFCTKKRGAARGALARRGAAHNSGPDPLVFFRKIDKNCIFETFSQNAGLHQLKKFLKGAYFSSKDTQKRGGMVRFPAPLKSCSNCLPLGLESLPP